MIDIPPASTPVTAQELMLVSYPDKVTELIRGRPVVDPRRRAADVHRPSGRASSGETRLDGEDVLPGFSCAVADLLR